MRAVRAAVQPFLPLCANCAQTANLKWGRREAPAWALASQKALFVVSLRSQIVATGDVEQECMEVRRAAPKESARTFCWQQRGLAREFKSECLPVVEKE